MRHSTVVSAGHGDATASTGAKKKPAPIYQADHARSQDNTNRNQRGTGRFSGLVVVLVESITPSTVPGTGKRSNYLTGSGGVRSRQEH